MERRELIALYAFALATRENTCYKSAIDTAIEAVDYLLEQLDELNEEDANYVS